MVQFWSFAVPPPLTPLQRRFASTCMAVVEVLASTSFFSWRSCPSVLFLGGYLGGLKKHTQKTPYKSMR